MNVGDIVTPQYATYLYDVWADEQVNIGKFNHETTGLVLEVIVDEEVIYYEPMHTKRKYEVSKVLCNDTGKVGWLRSIHLRSVT